LKIIVGDHNLRDYLLKLCRLLKTLIRLYRMWLSTHLQWNMLCTIVQLGEKLYNNYCRRNRNIVKKDWTFGIQFFYVNKCWTVSARHMLTSYWGWSRIWAPT